MKQKTIVVTPDRRTVEFHDVADVRVFDNGTVRVTAAGLVALFAPGEWAQVLTTEDD